MSNSPPPTRAAFCEEFNEDAQTTLPETRQTASTSSTANIAAKRSKPDSTRPKALRDEFSDSGYSSHTAATLGSGDSSSLESKLESYPLRAEPVIAESKTSPKGVEKHTLRRSQSPEKPTLQRTESKSRGYDIARRKDCECPQCLAKKARRATPPRLDTTRPDRVDVRPRHKELSPLSPQFQRTPRPYPAVQEGPVLQAAQPRPRASTSQSYQRARPMSFHAGAMPDPRYMSQPVFVERQPPPVYPTASPFAPPSYPPPHPSYFAPPLQPLPPPPQDFYAPIPAPTHSPYEVSPRPRPRLSTRPQSMYYEPSPPIMEYALPKYETPRSSAWPIERQHSRRQQPAQPRRESTAEDDHRKMPPPPPPPLRAPSMSRQEQRPVIRHAATTSDAYSPSHYRSAARDKEEDHYTSHPTSRKQSFEDPPRSRHPSVARPPPRASDERVAQALQLERDMARINITNVERDSSSPKSKRRVSVYGHESLKDLEGSVEAYQASKSGRDSGSIPQGDHLLRHVRKNTLTSNSSDAGSRVSGGSRASREGSDIKSPRHPSNDLNLNRHDSHDEAFAMRIPKGVNVNLQPGVEGRTISLRQNRDGDGDMELRIGERGRAGGVVGSRPAIRDQSRKRYSIVEGQAVVEAEPEPPRSVGRMPEEPPRSMSRMPEDVRVIERIEYGDDGQRRIVRERITTRTASRSRRSSRSAYSSRGQNEF